MTSKTEELKEQMKLLRENKGKLSEGVRALYFKTAEAELKGRTEMLKEVMEIIVSMELEYDGTTLMELKAKLMEIEK